MPSDKKPRRRVIAARQRRPVRKKETCDDFCRDISLKYENYEFSVRKSWVGGEKQKQFTLTATPLKNAEGPIEKTGENIASVVLEVDSAISEHILSKFRL